jgi:hypothetical protein
VCDGRGAISFHQVATNLIEQFTHVPAPVVAGHVGVQLPPREFCHHFSKIRRLTGIETGTFHDLRGTCLSNWVTLGLSLHEVKELAGHARIETTERFYRAIRTDVVDRARAASEVPCNGHSVARPIRITEFGEIDLCRHFKGRALENEV